MNRFAKAYFLIIPLFLIHFYGTGQSIISEKEQTVKQLNGFEKLVLLNEISEYYSDADLKKALKFGKQADLMAENFISSSTTFDSAENQLLIDSRLRYGILLYQKKSYLAAQNVFEETQMAAVDFRYSDGENSAADYLLKIDSLALAGKGKENVFKKAFSDIKIGSAISNSANSMSTSRELKLAKMYEKRGDTAVAIIHYENAANLLRNRGEINQAEEIENKIATYTALERMDSISKEIIYHPDTTTKIIAQRIAQDSTSLIFPEFQSETVQKDLIDMEGLKERADALENAQDFEASLELYKKYAAMQQKYQKDSALQVAAYNLVELEKERLRGQNEFADLNIDAIQREMDDEVRLKNILIVIAAFITVGLISILFLYMTKRKKHQLLSTAYTDLDTANGQLEEAQVHISRLLEQQVSPEIASALIEEKPQRTKQYVAVMFLDIRGFTPIAEKMLPEELIEYQNNVFGFMIEIIRKYHGNINQFMGDGFMATFGAPVSHGNDSRNAYLAAAQILEELKHLNESKKIPHTTLGIGVHAGHVVTGNVGTESRKQYSVTGSTVIIAARVEQLNKKYGTQLIITQEVFESLDQEDWPGDAEMEPVMVKGRSEPVNIFIYSEKEEVY